jgi:hypothetical protein
VKGFFLSRVERVARDPDALHRDAGQVRGRFHGERGRMSGGGE